MEPNGSSPGSSKLRHEILASSSTRPPGQPSPAIPFYASIRFSSSLTDLAITIPNVNDLPLPTVSTLKQQIRFLRPGETHNRRIRLILAGKVLGDHTVESNSGAKTTSTFRPCQSIEYQGEGE